MRVIISSVKCAHSVILLQQKNNYYKIKKKKLFQVFYTIKILTFDLTHMQIIQDSHSSFQR